MFLLFQRIRRDEEGQTLVLGAVSMLVLALCVMATINIGEATYERVRLQNTADAAAYSLAATQARAFNFFAYTNRAMIAHYHSMLTFMAYLSFMIYVDNTWGRLLDLLEKLPIPVLSQVVMVINKILEYAVKLFDYLVVVVVPALGVLNYSFFLMQIGMATSLGVQLLSNPPSLTENDPDVTAGLTPATGLGIGAKIANAYMLGKSIDWKGIARLVPQTPDWNKVVNPSPDGNFGRILMTELVNNSRHSWVVGEKEGIKILGRVWKIDVKIDFFITGVRVLLEKTARTEMGMRTGGANNRHDQLYSVDSMKFEFGAKFLGQGATIGLTYNAPIFGDWQKGDHKEKLSDCKIDFHGILDLVPGAEDKAEEFCDKIVEPINKAIDKYKAARGNSKHHFFFGVTPYFKFRPEATFKSKFNQPEYMVFVSKPSEKLAAFHQKKFGVEWPTDGTRIENSRGNDAQLDFAPEADEGFASFLGPGYNAMAAARCYYHRPGEWKEQPNFFNPFWGAKLVPIAQHELIQMAKIDDFLAPLNNGLAAAGLPEVKTSTIITH